MAADECSHRVPAVFHFVISLPIEFLKKTLKLALGAAFVGLCSMMTLTAHGDDMVRQAPSTHDDEAIPQPLQTEAFAALMASPPFIRSLNLSDSLILTGIAHFNEHVVATILDRETMKSKVISQTPNQEGWQLIGIGGDSADMNTWTAKIQVPGGEVVSIRYQEPPSKHGRGASGYGSGGNSPPLSTSQVEEAKKAAVNYREGFGSDGYPNQPPPEMVEKLSRLSAGQREDINREMIGIRNRGLGMDERRRIYEDKVNRAVQSRR